MQMILRYAKPVNYLLIIAMTMLSLPHGHARAAMVGTEAVIEAESGVSGESISSDRARIKALLQRQEARAQLETYGISAEEAQARIDSLTDGEIALVADRLNELPAGGYVDPHLGYMAVLAVFFLVVLIVALILQLEKRFGNTPDDEKGS